MPWTAADVPDLTGKTIVITGGNSGIGLQAALVVARRGATTVLACRDPGRAAAAVAQVTEGATGPVEAMALDLGSLASVRAFADAFGDRPLDVLVNNAGIMMTPYDLTADGFEQQLGTNHLGHFALTGLLLPRLLATPGARVVSVSSNGHRMGGSMDFDNLQFDGGQGYTPLRAYGRSKLANLLFTFELQRRLVAAGANAIAVAAHPGGANTNLARHIEGRWVLRLFRPLIEAFVQSAEMGALPTLRALADPEVAGADYFGPDGFQQQWGHPVRVGSSSEARDLEVARRLWEASEALTKVSYLTA